MEGDVTAEEAVAAEAAQWRRRWPLQGDGGGGNRGGNM